MNTRFRRSRCLAATALWGCLTVVVITGVMPVALTGMIDPFGYMGSFGVSHSVFTVALSKLASDAEGMPTLVVVLTAIVLLLSYGSAFTANYRGVLATASAIETQGKSCPRVHLKLPPGMEFSVGVDGIAGISPSHRSNGITNLPISISAGGSCV